MGSRLWSNICIGPRTRVELRHKRLGSRRGQSSAHAWKCFFRRFRVLAQGALQMGLFCSRSGRHGHFYSDMSLSVTCIDHIRGSKKRYRHKYAILVSHRADRTPSLPGHRKRACELLGNLDDAARIPYSILLTMGICSCDRITGLTSSQCPSPPPSTFISPASLE